MQLWLLNYIHLIKNLLCIKIVEDLAFLANQIKHSEDGEGKCILLLLSFIMSVSLQVPLKLIWWANPANKHEIHLTVWSIHWINCIVKQKPRTWKCFCLLFCRFSSHLIFFHSYGDASSQIMGLSPQAFSPTHGSTMLHSLVYTLKYAWTILTNQISSEQNLLGEP